MITICSRVSPFAGHTRARSTGPSLEGHFTPAVEVGWRLTQSAWGHGYASEAARRALTFALDDVELADRLSVHPFDQPRQVRPRPQIPLVSAKADCVDNSTGPDGKWR
jgi:ribosomal-protein-alanine N-acetyltransferase